MPVRKTFQSDSVIATLKEVSLLLAIFCSSSSSPSDFYNVSVAFAQDTQDTCCHCLLSSLPKIFVIETVRLVADALTGGWIRSASYASGFILGNSGVAGCLAPP